MQKPIATYIKVGKIVYIHVNMTFNPAWGIVSDVGSAYDDFNFRNLPFAAKGYNMQIEVGLYGNYNGYGILGRLLGRVSNNQTNVFIENRTLVGQKDGSNDADVTSVNIEGFYESAT